MSPHTLTSFPELEDSASPPNQTACEPLSLLSATPPDSATSDITGPACLSSPMSTTLTPSSAQLWPTVRVCSAMGASITDKRAEDAFPNLETVIARHTHSSSPPESRASQPVPPVSAKAVQMTVGSGRRLCEWLPNSGPVGVCLKTLLASPAWRSPLRSLEWTLKGYAGCPDEPSQKSSKDLTFWDMTSRETGMASLGFRVCRLSVSELSTEGTGSGLLRDVETWMTPNCPRERDADDCISAEYRSQNQKTIHRQAQSHADLWATPRSNAATGAGEHVAGAPNIQTQVAFFQSGQPQSLSAEPTASRGQLNPDFVCWLMGYPAGWLNYADLETPLSRKSRRKSSKQSLKVTV